MFAAIRKHAAPAGAVALIAGLLAVSAPSANAATSPPVRFVKVYYDSPGTDSGSNASLNAEWIRIKNYSTVKKYLTGWTVRDKSGHVYKFGTFALIPGASVTLYTGSGANSSTKRYWAYDGYIWNNSGDTAYLRNASGTLVDTCAWSSVGVGYKLC